MSRSLSQIRERHLGAALGLRRAHGQHTPTEAATLALHAAGKRACVEIGAAEGVTAAVLRSVMNRDGTLWLFDPYERRYRGVSAARVVARRTVGRAKGTTDVRWVRRYSTDAGREWSDALDFVFIDGDHSEDVCAQDWNNFAPHVVPGGRVAFHDSALSEGGQTNPTWGPVRVCDRIFRNSETRDPAWRIVEEVDSITVVERVR